MVKKVCKKCGKEIKDKRWPVGNTGGLCPDCAYEDFLGKSGGIVGGTHKNGKLHEKRMMFEKQLAIFLGEFEAYAQIADDEDRFLTTDELKKHEGKLMRIWEEHIRNQGMQEHLELFRQCYSCQNRNSHADTIMTLGVIRCENQDCSKNKEFSRMFNTIYTRRDIDRAREHMDELLKTPEDFTPDNSSNVSGETMERNTNMRQKDTEKEKDAKEMMYT